MAVRGGNKVFKNVNPMKR